MRPGAKGVTLLELMVAGSLMALMSLILYWVLIYANAGQRKQDSAAEGDRSCAIAMAHIQDRVLTARVIKPLLGESSDTLVYQLTARDETGNFVVGPGGLSEWLGPVVISLRSDPDSDQRLLYQGELADPSHAPIMPEQVLARLGPLGELRFSRLSERILEVSVLAKSLREGDTTRSYSSTSVAQLYLQNQAP